MAVCSVSSIYKRILIRLYTHGKQLGNASCITRINFGLTFPYILKVYQRNFLNQHLKFLQSENDEYQAITVARIGHYRYRNLISDFRTLSIILAKIPSMKSDSTLVFKTKKLIVCVTNFDHNLLLSWLFVGGGAYFTNGKITQGVSKVMKRF